MRPMETELLEKILDTVIEIKESLNEIQKQTKLKNTFKTIMSIKEFSEATDLAEYVVRRMVKEGDAVTYNCGNKIYIHYEKTIEKMFE